MKKACSLIFISIILNLSAQNSESSKIFIIDYDFYLNFENSQLYKSSLMIANNKQIFKWGNNQKEFKEENDEKYDFAVTITNGDSIGSFNFYDRKSDLLISRIKWLSNKEYFVEEKNPKINWKIENEFKQVGEISCQKATGRFRGRLYTAWFSIDFPINAGPWKLSGLPGLILEAKDNAGKIHFIFDKIYYGKSSQFPDYELEKREKITIQEFAKIQNSLGKELAKKVMAKMPRGSTIEFVNSESIEIFDEKSKF